MSVTARALHVGDVVKGRCVYWNREKRFGFVNVEGVSADVFVGWRALQASTDLRVGEAVRLEVAMGRDGRLAACFVELLDGSEEAHTP